jgi:excisionase family DNA binding protein
VTIELLTVEDVARVTGLSAYTVRAAVREGDLVASKLRGRIRVHPEALAAWIDESRVRPVGSSPRDLTRPTPHPRAAPPSGGYRQAARARRRAA